MSPRSSGVILESIGGASRRAEDVHMYLDTKYPRTNSQILRSGNLGVLEKSFQNVPRGTLYSVDGLRSSSI